VYTETEIKLHVKDLDKLARRLDDLEASRISPRTFEKNLRFDTPAETLSAQACVLRLRQDAQSKLTFKGPTLSQDGVAHREEIEFTVGDFDAASLFLERLGYQIVNIYEKYRTTYELDKLHIMLDEMPYGDFIEIEGENSAEIIALAEKLLLDVNATVKMSYLEIFELLVSAENLSAQALTFDAFVGQQWMLGNVAIHPADSSYHEKKTYNKR